MWTKTSEGNKLVRELSQEIVAEIAPEEVEIFTKLIDEYFQNPEDLQELPQEYDDPLSFGVDEIVIAITPIAAALVVSALNYLLTQVVKISNDETAEDVKKKIKLLFQPVKKDGTDAFSKKQLKLINKLAEREAIKFGVSPQKAENIAKALIGSLITK